MNDSPTPFPSRRRPLAAILARSCYIPAMPRPPRGRTVLFALLLFGCTDSFVAPDAGPRDAGTDRDVALPAPTTRIATWNVERFFDMTCDTGRCGGGDFEEVPGPALFREDARRVAFGIGDLDAAVVVLQEVETQAALDAVLAELGDAYPSSVLGEIDEPGSLDVAILSKFPVLEVRRHRGDTRLERPDGSNTRFTRELLEVHFDADQQRLIVFAAHFKAKVNDDPGRRFAEAEATGRIALDAASAHPDAILVVAGDLNDVPTSEPLEALREAGLVRVGEDRPAESVATYRFDGALVAIDHLFVLARDVDRYAAGSATTLRTGSGYAGSDHRALRADFLISDRAALAP